MLWDEPLRPVLLPPIVGVPARADPADGGSMGLDGGIDTEPVDEHVAATLTLLAAFERDVVLATGTAVRVRAATASDVERLRAFYLQLDDASNALRFFGLRRFIPDDELRRATVQDVHHQVTLFAELAGSIIGVGEFHAQPGGMDAEVAFAVADAHHHEGVATILLEDLALIALAAGFRRLVAETLPHNRAMLGVFGSVGLLHRHWFDDGVVHVELDLSADDLLQDHSDLRDWQSAVRSLASIMRPTHVVVVDTTSVGRRIVDHVGVGFTGRLSVVLAPADSDGGVGLLSGLERLGATPDLALIAVPADFMTDVVAGCGRAGVLTAVIVSKGFADRGADGLELQDGLLAVARTHGMRLVGPSSLGVVATGCGLNATYVGEAFLPGAVAIASQSSGMGIAIAAEVRRRRAGISSFVSTGDKLDVSGNDLLRLWADDDATNVVLLQLESFGDPVRFARVARAVSARKPVVALAAGAGRPDSAFSAGDRSGERLVDALFAHTGVIRAETLEQLVDVGVLLERQSAPAGLRVAVIGNADGPMMLCAAAAEAHGLKLPALSLPLRAQIVGLVPDAASTANPVDVGSGVTADGLAAVVRAVGESGEVDACLVVWVDVDGSHRATGATFSGISLGGVPVAVTVFGDHDSETGLLPSFPSPERAAVAMARAAGRAGWLAMLARDATDETMVLDASAFVDARSLARGHAGVVSEITWLNTVDSFELLTSAGLPVAPSHYARSADECAGAAARLGYPAVVKADITDVRHKTEAGVVVVGIGDPATARATYEHFARHFDDRMRGVVVQAQLPKAFELLAGIIRDPTFGPHVVVGAGGVEAELRVDEVVLVAPVSRSAARRAVESLRLAPLFHGFHGRPEISVDPVVDLVHRLGMLAAAVPEIRRLQLNPVLIDHDGSVAAVDAVIGVAASTVFAGPMRGLRVRRRTDG